jgi:hypothetical protein
MPTDKQIRMNRAQALKDKFSELEKDGKSGAEADRGAKDHLAKLADTDPENYLTAIDREARVREKVMMKVEGKVRNVGQKAMEAAEKERKAREQEEGEGKGEGANGGSERRGSATGPGSSGGHVGSGGHGR